MHPVALEKPTRATSGGGKAWEMGEKKAQQVARLAIGCVDAILWLSRQNDADGSELQMVEAFAARRLDCGRGN